MGTARSLLGKSVRAARVRQLGERGLTLPDDCRIISWPDWGSEPYLITIGRQVTISSGVVFITHDGGTAVFRDEPAYRDVVRYGRIVLQDGCFIGSGVTLLPGVEIGAGSLVGARALVTTSVPPGVVVAGVPARTISTVPDYAERCRLASPEYDVTEYRRNKRAVLEELFPPRWQ